MCSINYLKPFMEVGRALSDGVDSHSVMSLITRRIAETLSLKGCFVKAKSPKGNQLELLSSYGLSEGFLFVEPNHSPESVCFRLPDSILCVPSLEQADHVPEQEAMMIEGIRSVALIPIEVEQEILAVSVLFAGSPREFLKEELNFAQTLTGYGILSLNWKRRMDEQLERERQYLRSFQEVSSTINASLNIGKVLELVVTKVTEALGAKGSMVRLLDSKTNNLYLAQSYGLSKEFITKGPVDAQKSIAENMAGKIVVIEDVYADPRLQYPAQTIEEGIRKLISIPLTVRGKVIGVLRILTGDRPPFAKEEIQFATAIAQQCALAIENARIYQRVKYEYQQLLTDFGYEGSSSDW